MDNGQTTVPMVVWAAIGRGWGSGAQHSQAIHGMLLGVPGLKIVMPSTPADAKGLLLSAILDNNPVCVFEHRWLMKKDGVVPEGFYRVPIGKGVYRRRGTRRHHRRRVACDRARHAGGRASLAAEGIDAEVVDLRTVKPLDEEIVLGVARTRPAGSSSVDTAWMKRRRVRRDRMSRRPKRVRAISKRRLRASDCRTCRRPPATRSSSSTIPDAARIAAARAQSESSAR